MTRNNETVLYEVGHWNGYNLDILTSTYRRASLVPAAAVIPAPVMYRIIVAVKKFVVGLLNYLGSTLTGAYSWVVFYAFVCIDFGWCMLRVGLL